VSHPLVERMKNSDPEERLRACREAPEDPAAVLFAEALAHALGDPVKAVAGAASDALAALARDHDVTEVLHAALHGGEPLRSLWAALTLARLEPPGLRSLPALVEGLGLPDGKLRWRAARTLVQCGRLHGEVLPLVLGLSRRDERPVVRRMARHCLRELARDDPSAARALLDGTRDPDVLARRAAYAALTSLVDPPPEVLDALGKALSAEPDAACRRIASVALGAIGTAAPDPVLAALRRASEDPDDPALRRGATRALESIARQRGRG